MEPTFTARMFTPHFPGNSQEFDNLTFDQADAKAATWIIQLQAEGYTLRSDPKNERGKKLVFNAYRAGNPTWVRITVKKEG